MQRRILIISPCVEIGGAEVAALRLAAGLAKKPTNHVDFYVISDVAKDRTSLKIPDHIRLNSLHEKNTTRAFLKLIRLMRVGKYDVIISHQRHLNVLVAVAAFFAGCRSKVVVVEHGVPLFVYPWADSPKERFLEALVPFAYQLVALVVSASSICAEKMKVKWPSLARKIHHCPNPILESSNALEATSQATPTVVLAGRLDPVKDFQLALEAFALMQGKIRAKLLILGDGSERKALENLATKLGIAEITTFAGFVEKPSDYMRKASTLLVTSKIELFGNVIVEAMSVGCNVVAVDCPVGPREILEGGKWGELVLSRKPQDICDALIRSIQSPKAPLELHNRSQSFTIESSITCYGLLLDRLT